MKTRHNPPNPGDATVSETIFYTTAGDDAVRVEIPDREDDLALINEWLDLIRRVVNQRAMKRIYARQTAEVAAKGINPS